jgi:hypothetical protein
MVLQFDPSMGVAECQLALVLLAFRSASPGSVPFKALDQPPGLGGWKSFVKRRLAVDVCCGFCDELQSFEQC